MDSKVDIEKSIQAKRLIYKGTFGQLAWTYFFTYAGCILTIAFFYFLLINTTYRDAPIVTICVLCSLTLLVFVNAIFLDKLYVIKCSDQNSTVALLTRKLQNLHPKITIDHSNAGILAGEVNSKFWRFDRIFTLLFYDGYMALNLSVGGRGRGSMKYCLISIWNYYKCKAILKSFKSA